MKDEKDMLFLLEHFSLSDMIKAENDVNKMFDQDTDNIKDIYHEDKWYDTSMISKKNTNINIHLRQDR